MQMRLIAIGGVLAASAVVLAAQLVSDAEAQTPPEGYRKVWEDGRINPDRGLAETQRCTACAQESRDFSEEFDYQQRLDAVCDQAERTGMAVLGARYINPSRAAISDTFMAHWEDTQIISYTAVIAVIDSAFNYKMSGVMLADTMDYGNAVRQVCYNRADIFMPE